MEQLKEKEILVNQKAIQPQIKKKKKGGDGIRRPGMVKLGDYVDYQYLPELMKYARQVPFPSQPSKVAIQNECLIYLLFKLGRRPEELVRMKVRDIDFVKRDIVFNIMKKRRLEDKTQNLPMDIETSDYLQEYVKEMKLEPDHFIFSWFKSGNIKQAYYQHLDRRKAWFIIHESSRLSGITARNGRLLGPRIMRHSFAIYNIKRGRTLNVVQDLLCHSDISTTAIYAKFNRDDLREQIDKTFDDEKRD